MHTVIIGRADSFSIEQFSSSLAAMAAFNLAAATPLTTFAAVYSSAGEMVACYAEHARRDEKFARVLDKRSLASIGLGRD